MSAEISAAGALGRAPRGRVSFRSDTGSLHALVVACGIGASIVFVVVGLRYELQLYADGSIFSYAVAVQDAWGFHWHNISGRLFVYLFCHLPAEAYVGLTGDARGGIDIYGFLFFGSQLFGLAATYAADRSAGRTIFVHACFSVACICPLVFGYPTELWVAHAFFWPALAVCRYAPGGLRGSVLCGAVLAALVFTHEGALVFALAILVTLLGRGLQSAAFIRTASALFVVMLAWALVKLALPPDANFSSILVNVALNCIDLTSLTRGVFLLLAITAAGYGTAWLVLRRMTHNAAPLYAAAVVAAALGAYWLWFDTALQGDDRYYQRTALLLGTPALGALAVWRAMGAESASWFSLPDLPRLKALLDRDVTAHAVAGAVLLVTLIHVVETAKFVNAWNGYKDAVKGLAAGTVSDPALGNARFVSARRIGKDEDRLSWPSTTQFLSVLLAPSFAPRMLVVDPRANYFWIACDTAAASQSAERAIPVESRRLIRAHTCLHR